MDQTQPIIQYTTVSDSVYLWVKNAIIQGELTFCFHDHGLWFYFKACTGEVKLKQKLNSLL